MKKFILFALIFSIALALSANYADALSCSVKASCSGGEAAVLRMQDVLGGHAGIWNSSYPNVLCCSEPGVALGRDCSALGSDYVLNLSADTDAHVQKNTMILPNYPVAACLSGTPFRAFDCQYDSNTACSNFGAGYSCVASVSGDTNAHIGNCTAYTTAVTPQPNVCCKAGQDSTPPQTSMSFNPVSPNGKNNWYTVNVAVTLLCSDPGPVSSGCASTQYHVNGEAWQAYLAPFTISAEANNSVEYYSTDNAGNSETAKISYAAVDKTPPYRISASDSPDPVESGKNVTFSVACTDAVSRCANINITSSFSSCAAQNASSCGITSPAGTPSGCNYATYSYNATAEDYAGLKNSSVPMGAFDAKKAEGCACIAAAECFGNFCLSSKCVTPSPPSASSESLGDIIVPLGTQGQAIVTVKNTLAVEDDVDVSVAGNPQKVQNWLWFDGHRYDDARYKVRLHLAAGEEKAVAVQIFGGEVTTGWSDTPSIRISAKSSLTGLESEVSKTVSIMYSDDGLTVQTPDVGWIGVAIIAVVGALLL